MKESKLGIDFYQIIMIIFTLNSLVYINYVAGTHLMIFVQNKLLKFCYIRYKYVDIVLLWLHQWITMESSYVRLEKSGED